MLISLPTLKVRKIKPVVFCGDLNVAHTEIDLANPKTNRKNAGFTDEERSSFDAIVEAGFVDSFRHLYPIPPNAILGGPTVPPREA